MSKTRFSCDASWISELLAQHEGPLLRYVQRVIGCPDRARDIVQEAFLALSKEPPNQHNGHAAQWLYTVCRHRALDVRRKESRMVSESGAVLENRITHLAGPESVAESREDTSRVEQLVSQLPDAQQEVVRLKFGGGLSYREIAEVTGHSVGNVGFLLHTAIATLRKQMTTDA